MKKIATMEQSVSLEKASETLNVPPAFLTMLCNHDKKQTFFHLTTYSKHIRFTPDELQRAKKKITNLK